MFDRLAKLYVTFMGYKALLFGWDERRLKKFPPPHLAEVGGGCAGSVSAAIASKRIQHTILFAGRQGSNVIPLYERQSRTGVKVLTSPLFGTVSSTVNGTGGLRRSACDQYKN